MWARRREERSGLTMVADCVKEEKEEKEKEKRKFFQKKKKKKKGNKFFFSSFLCNIFFWIISFPLLSR